MHCKNSSIFHFSFPSCWLICNRITFSIFSNIIGIRSDPKCSCWIPTVFKALTLLSIRLYNSLNSVTLNHLLCLILSIRSYVWKLLAGDSQTFLSKVQGEVFYSLLVFKTLLLKNGFSFLCTATSNDSSNCFYLSMSLSNFCNTNFGNLTPVCTLKLSMF